MEGRQRGGKIGDCLSSVVGQPTTYYAEWGGRDMGEMERVRLWMGLRRRQRLRAGCGRPQRAPKLNPALSILRDSSPQSTLRSVSTSPESSGTVTGFSSLA